MFHLFPAWNGLHPVVVHFPVILLLFAPLLVILGIILPEAQRRPFLASALTLMVLGTSMTYLAATTGVSATKVITSTPAVAALLEEHRSLAATTRELFSVLTLVFAALLFVPRLLRRGLDSWVRTSLIAAFLLFYGTGAVLLIDTALKGSHLVQELGARRAVTCHLPNKGGR
jgi:uncharacterized membrane protein